MKSANVATSDKQGRSINTGSLAYWDGQQWQVLPDEDGDATRDMLGRLIIVADMLYREVMSLRLGMIEVGTCNEAKQTDVDRAMIET